ncbi:MAG: FecR domain-containing protein [Aridibacter sp.]
MREKFVKLISVCAVLCFVSIGVLAQNDSRTAKSAAGSLYVISAKAGGVNLTQGSVLVRRKNSTNGIIVKGDKVEVGDKVITDKNSKAEILLNPGSYARLGENSEFEFVSTSLDDLSLRLNRGSAIFEVFADDDFKVTINAPNARFYLIESGVYRVDVLADGNSRLQVWKGKAQTGDVDATIIKKSRKVVMNGSQVAVEKFDRDEKDSFDEWSKDRAKDLANANASLQRRTLRTSLVNSFSSNRWGGFNTYGLWAYDASFGGFCFLPFGYGWSSPYGYGFGRNFFSSQPSNSFYNLVYRRTIINNGGTNNQGNNNSGSGNFGNGNSGTNNPNPTINNPTNTNPGRSNPGRISPPMRQVEPSPRNLPGSNPSEVRRPSKVNSPVIDQ